MASTKSPHRESFTSGARGGCQWCHRPRVGCQQGSEIHASKWSPGLWMNIGSVHPHFRITITSYSGIIYHFQTSKKNNKKNSRQQASFFVITHFSKFVVYKKSKLCQFVLFFPSCCRQNFKIFQRGNEEKLCFGSTILVGIIGNSGKHSLWRRH